MIEKIKRVAKEIVKPTKRPEGPIDYFVYKGVFGILLQTAELWLVGLSRVRSYVMMAMKLIFLVTGRMYIVHKRWLWMESLFS